MSQTDEWKFPAVLDASCMKEWKSCERKWWHKYVEGKSLTGDDVNVDLLAGKAWAAGMEGVRLAYYVEGLREEEAIEKGWEELVEVYGKDRPAEVKNHARLREAFSWYWAVWPLSWDSGIVPVGISGGIESTFNFVIPGLMHPDTGEPLLYAGKRDLIGVDKSAEDMFGGGDEELWGLDEKTAAYVNDGWQRDYQLDWQFLGYTYFERFIARNKIEGVVIRKIGLKRKIFDRKLDLKEAKIRYGDEVLSDWYEEMLNTAEKMVVMYKACKGDGHNWTAKAFGNPCNEYSGCSFRPLCMRSNVVPDYKIFRWNPLKREGE